ncbi:hypothetical protein LNKW23_18740 [Paralimibaculum aggregatum]|uniref:DNA/RNA non-specific endonuclease n=1 Tax=Paralimibaculum aggregatum TaxID=3036245 RepID=A0ABQ6LJS1_9RHOB|nr:DUF4781 domain-containing protein [Limibaculum sp. NKW23]GMG82661.1 hypothetical protein LNKW23_18740 [Limibaculum sp. NKW23]
MPEVSIRIARAQAATTEMAVRIAVERYFQRSSDWASDYISRKRGEGALVIDGENRPLPPDAPEYVITLDVDATEIDQIRKALVQGVQGLTPAVRRFVFGSADPEQVPADHLDDYAWAIDLAQSMFEEDRKAFLQAHGRVSDPVQLARLLEAFLRDPEDEAAAGPEPAELFEGVEPDRVDAIFDWLGENGDARDQFGQSTAGNALVIALKGGGTLGPLTPEERRALARSAADHWIGLADVADALPEDERHEAEARLLEQARAAAFFAGQLGGEHADLAAILAEAYRRDPAERGYDLPPGSTAERLHHRMQRLADELEGKTAPPPAAPGEAPEPEPEPEPLGPALAKARQYLNGIVVPDLLLAEEKAAYETRRAALNAALDGVTDHAALDTALGRIDAFAADIGAARRDAEDAADPHEDIGPEPAEPPTLEDRIALLTTRLSAIVIHDRADDEAKIALGDEKMQIIALLATAQDDGDLYVIERRIRKLANAALWAVPLKERLAIDDATAARLDGWIAGKSGEGDERLTGAALAEALKGGSGLGELGENEKRYLATRACSSWVPDPEIPPEDTAFHAERLADIRALTEAARGDGAMAKIVADAMLEQNPGRWEFLQGEKLGHVARVRDILSKMDFAAAELDPAGYAGRYPGAEEGLALARRATGSEPYPPPSDGVGAVAEAVGNDEALLKQRGPGPMSEEARNGLLEAAAAGAMDPAATNAFVTAMYGATSPDEAEDPAYRKALAAATAKLLNAASGAADGDARMTKRRLETAMGTESGREVMFNPKVSPALRNWALGQIAPGPGLPGAKPLNPYTLEDGWESKAISQAFARKQIEEAMKTAPAPVKVRLVDASGSGRRGPNLPSGAALNAIGQALGMTPDRTPKNETPEERARRLEAGIDYPYFDHTKQPFANLKEKWKEENPLGGVQDLTVQPIPVTVTSNAFGAAVFKVLRMNSGTFTYFVDAGGRTYKNVADWTANNKLPAGQMTYPAELELGGRLITATTPAGTPGSKVTEIMDDVAVAAGIAAGVAAIAGTGGVATPAVAAAVAGYTTARAAEKAADRSEHGFDITDMSDPENRALMYDLASGPLSIAGIGGSMRAASLAAKGMQMGRGASTVIAGLQVAGNVLGGVQNADQILQLRKTWHRLTPEQKNQAMMQLGMQAAMGAAGMTAKKVKGEFVLDDYSFTRTRNILEHGSPYNLRKALPKDGIPEGGVAVRHDPPDNPKTFEIVYNAASPPSRFMLELHGRAAANMEMSVGLEGRFRAFLKGTKYGDPEHAPDPKTAPVAWEAAQECRKIRDESFQIARRLADPDLPEPEQAQIRKRLAELAYALRMEQERLRQFDQLMPKGYVASPGDAADIAKQKGYPPLPQPYGSGKPEYKWSITARGLQPVPIHPDVPGLRIDPKTRKFTYLLNRGWRDEGAPRGERQERNWYANNPEPDTRYEYEDGSVYETDGQGRTKRVQMSFPTPPAQKAVKWDRDSAITEEVGHVGVEGDPTENFDGGHLIPRELGGAPGKLNIVPMQRELNQNGAWRGLEKQWYAEHHAGNRVEIDIQVVYHGSGNEARRQTPKRFKVRTTIARRKKGPDGRFLRDQNGEFVYGKPEVTEIFLYNTGDGKQA